MRIVLDTSVVLSALLWRGTPYHLLSAISQRPELRIYSSTALPEKLADLLARPTANRRLTLIGRSAGAVLADYVEAIVLPIPAACRAWWPAMSVTIRSLPPQSRRAPT